jgi:hypothetical protein
VGCSGKLRVRCGGRTATAAKEDLPWFGTGEGRRSNKVNGIYTYAKVNGESLPFADSKVYLFIYLDFW